MKMAVVADERSKQEFLFKRLEHAADLCFVNRPEDIPADASIVFDLLFEHTSDRVSLLREYLPRPVFVNAVKDTLLQLGQPFIRLNAWPGFLKRDLTEIAVLPGQEQAAYHALDYLGWNYISVPDTAGMVSARVISMIINEAYFTLEGKVSTKEEIDIAMKAGTHYPFGPFEWSRQIGLCRIYDMLLQLCREDHSCEISSLLAAEARA